MQVGSRRGQPSRGRHGLVVVRVNATRFGMNQFAEAVRVGAFQLGKFAPLEHERRQGMAAGELLQHFFSCGRRAAGRFALAWQAQFLEQNMAELLRRADFEWFSGLCIDLFFKVAEALPHFAGERGQHIRIDADPGDFHVRQHAQKRKLDPLCKRQQRLLPEFFLQYIREAQGDVRVFACVRTYLFGRHVPHRLLIFPRSDKVFDGNRLVVQKLQRQRIQAVRFFRRQQVMRHHRIEKRAFRPQAMPLQHDHVVLRVLTDLARRSAQRGSQQGQRLFRGRAIR